jgi:lysophospholipase L1-like esterase
MGFGAAGGGLGADANVAGTGGPAASGGANDAPGGSSSLAGGGGASTASAGASAGGTSSGGMAGAGGGMTVSPVPLDPALMSSCSGSKPIKCTIRVPANGNYDVTVELGSAQVASTSQVEAELYRIVVPPVKLAAGAYSQQTFSVNVRSEAHDDYSAPGKELNILIDGDAPALHGLGYAAASIPTLFVVGDSTVCDWDPAHANLGPTERGWAQELSQFMKPGLAVADYADAGDTAGSLYGKFASRGAVLKEGDYLFIQFGHNDMKSQADIDHFKANLLKFIMDARTAKATPILFSPVARRAYLDNHDEPTTLADAGFNGLDQQVRDLAAAEHVALVDLTKLAITYYATVDAKQLFTSTAEIAHFNIRGATAISKLVADALKAGTTPMTPLGDFFE